MSQMTHPSYCAPAAIRWDVAQSCSVTLCNKQEEGKKNLSGGVSHLGSVMSLSLFVFVHSFNDTPVQCWTQTPHPWQGDSAS